MFQNKSSEYSTILLLNSFSMQIRYCNTFISLVSDNKTHILVHNIIKNIARINAQRNNLLLVKKILFCKDQFIEKLTIYLLNFEISNILEF